jgi:hypothetical protein
MPSQHRLKSRSFRPEPDEYDDAKAALPAGRTIDHFLRACLRWLRHDPKEALATLAPFWPGSGRGDAEQSKGDHD